MFRFLVAMVLAVSSAQAFAYDGNCVCKAYNLSKCDGTGPVVLKYYLFSDPDRKSHEFDVTVECNISNSMECENLNYKHASWRIPVFNYYGDIVQGCHVVWNQCQFTSN